MVSIIVPVYNTEKYIRNCLKSIQEQTYSDIEVILINDGSTDDSGKICDSFSEIDSRFKVFHIKNSGVSKARNIGIAEASGKYVVFVDSDDWLEADFCSQMVKGAEENSAQLVICGNYNESSYGSSARSVFPGDAFFEGKAYENDILIPTMGLICEKLKNPAKLDKLTPVWARMYLRDKIISNGIQFIDLYKLPSECLQFNIDYCMVSNNALYIDKAMYHYRRNNTVSVTKPYRNNLINKWQWWYEYIRKEILEKKYSEELIAAFYSRICCSVIPLGGNALKLRKYKQIRKEVKKFLGSNMIRLAYQNFSFISTSIHWKVFFLATKYQLVDLFIFMTWIMRKILDRRKT